ncbi:hypothetical protein E8E14_002767 [Neopestalotiopsis sp. 37M]|nr:hypothetical protein E8E14_002767 [Neopestalotiopsis sp. 37M]
MSGLEPLAALSLACNVLQLVEVGHQTITLIKIVYQGKLIDDALDQKAAILGGISDEVKTYKRPAQCPKHEQQLLAAADRCSIAARDLREEIQFLVGNAKKGSLASTLKVVAKTNWRRRRLERLKENLDSTEKLLHTGLLTRIWSGTNTAAIDIKELKGDLRSFIERYRNGHRNTDELVSRESLEVRKHVSSVSAETIDSLGILRQSLDGMILDTRSQGSQAKRDRLLGSLKFGGFNERRSQVRAAYKDTGKWIFAGDGDESEVVEYPASSVSGGESTASKKFQEETQNLEDNTVDIKWDSFSNWLRSTDVFYWISGKPGSGKTTLVKFIAQHPSTEVLLNIWQPRPLIISHFLWRPGTLLQRSIKGMLCSLLHQLLQDSSRILDCALSSFPYLRTKDADTDWSVEELRTLCLRVISTYERPVCLFLDGLDEVDIQDGVVHLLDLVHELSQSRNIKICLSSRPEPLLQKRLSGYPQLRLQDLNKRDLKSYARDHIRLPEWTSMNRLSYSLIDSVADRAQGVFLWLVFAINSINKGVEYGDTIDLVNTRLRQLPGDLVEMYKDMWKRTCADEPLEYRQTAALYFKLMLMHGRNQSLIKQPPFSLELFTLVLASTSLADEILHYGDETPKHISEDRIIQLCQTVKRQLDVYCFGLLELAPLTKDEADRIKALGLYGDKYDRVLPLTGGTSRQMSGLSGIDPDTLKGTITQLADISRLDIDRLREAPCVKPQFFSKGRILYYP